MITIKSNPNSLITNLYCTYCAEEYSSNDIHTVCKKCGKVLYAKYDLEKAKETITKKSIQARTVYNIWRW
ncbi:MAG: hypothetical protein KAR08_12065, partial [Candidatus Heimdallarchaeota archaeon]|nr:hypothetical protein [Candidatus Heimdallarchaeota archaeon]